LNETDPERLERAWDFSRAAGLRGRRLEDANQAEN
jgi:hypothetical protein